MKKPSCLAPFACALVWLAPVTDVAPAEGERPSTEAAAAFSPVATLRLQIHARTWRSRGRVSFAVEPTLRLKLAAAGLALAQHADDPYDFTLIVDYREERGNPISLDVAGTDITCTVSLDHPVQGRLLHLVIGESPSYAELIDAPYVDAVQKLETNPYFYFLGDLVRERIVSGADVTGSLIEGLRRQVKRDTPPAPTPLDTLPSPADTFPLPDILYGKAARENTIDELGRLKDPRATTILTELLAHADWETRLRAVAALGEVGAGDARPAIEHLAQSDVHPRVRDAARTVLSRLTGPPGLQ